MNQDPGQRSGFAIRNYHNVSEIYGRIDEMVRNPIHPIRRDEMEKCLAIFQKKQQDQQTGQNRT